MVCVNEETVLFQGIVIIFYIWRKNCHLKSVLSIADFQHC